MKKQIPYYQVDRHVRELTDLITLLYKLGIYKDAFITQHVHAEIWRCRMSAELLNNIHSAVAQYAIANGATAIWRLRDDYAVSADADIDWIVSDT